MPRRNRARRVQPRPLSRELAQPNLTTDQMAWRLVRQGKVPASVLGPVHHDTRPEQDDNA